MTVGLSSEVVRNELTGMNDPQLPVILHQWLENLIDLQ